MLEKQKLLDTLNAMPDEFSIEELMEKLILLQKIGEGLNHIEKGEIYTSSEAKEKLAKWLK